MSVKTRAYLAFMTGFTKRGLPYTFNLPTLTIHNFRLVNATDLKFGQQEASTWIYSWRMFQLLCHLIIKLWSSKFIELNVFGRPLFANPVTFVRLIVIWSPYTNCDKVILEGVQRKAAQYVQNDFSRYSSIKSKPNNLQWISLEDRRTQSRLPMFYKIIHNIVHVNFNSYLHPSGTITRGHQQRYV